MKERDYVLATDARALDVALAALRTIAPASNPVVSARQLAAIIKSLDTWAHDCRAQLGPALTKE